jgi:two-component system chemotaxis response regulator CheB
VYVAPAGYHLLVDETRIALSTEPPVWQVRPSVDVALDSAAFAFGRKLVAVILSGASFDGSRGVIAVRRRGGHVVVQSPASAETVEERTMPEAVLARDVADRVLPLGEIAAYLTFFCHRETERTLQ